MFVLFIISEAIYLSLQDREHQPILDSGYVTFGLNQLNFILDEWRDKIPFSQLLTFNNYTQLTNTKFLSVSNISYVLNTVQMPLQQVNLTRFIELQNVIGLLGVPQIFYWDELNQTIQVYPAPSNPVYQFTVWGRMADAPLLTTDVVPSNIPQFMVNALIYQLGYRLAIQYNSKLWNDGKNAIRMELIELLTSKKSIDITPRRNLVFGRPDVGGVPPYPWIWAISGGTQV